jgi:hypothetical protein
MEGRRWRRWEDHRKNISTGIGLRLIPPLSLLHALPHSDALSLRTDGE